MTEMKALVVGDGLLADLVCRQLIQEEVTVLQQVELPSREKVPSVDVALVLHDAWQPAVHVEAEGVFRSSRTPWLRGFVSFGQGVIGPLVSPEQPGCSQCADTRRLMAGADRAETWALKQALMHGGLRRDPLASQLGLNHLSRLIVRDANRIGRGMTALTDCHLYLVNLRTFQTSLHRILPDPLCTVCTKLPDDAPTLAQISLCPSLKIGEKGYRSRSVADLETFLRSDYLDYQTGLLNGKAHDLVSPFANASVNLPLLEGDEGCAGRTDTYSLSELTAILEGLERYCGLAPRGKQTVVHDSYDHLSRDALNPETVGLHAKAHYDLPDFPYQPFRPHQPMDWVWGYSCLHHRPILVPQRLAYYSLGCEDGFVYETSNGCALGGSLSEAIFYGLLEVVERDAFLMTWYARLSLPQLDASTSADKELCYMIDGLRTVAGYDLYLFNATMENGIPGIFAIAKNQRSTGVNLICAAGAHLDPVRAAKGAIHELAGMVFSLNQQFEENREKCERMFADPYQVRHMEDHSLLYSLPQAEQRLEFLLSGNSPVQRFEEAFPLRPWHLDLTDDLRDLLAAFEQLQLDVIIVDQTSPELTRNGLYCVKVLIPGMLPMTFGHHLTRLEGLSRVHTVPVKLGYAPDALTREQLNPHPHPFP